MDIKHDKRDGILYSKLMWNNKYGFYEIVFMYIVDVHNILYVQFLWFFSLGFIFKYSH